MITEQHTVETSRRRGIRPARTSETKTMSRPNREQPMGTGRGFKRFARKNAMSDPLYAAYSAGEWAAASRPAKRNPYPPGRRHDEWARGYREADPWGDHHGRNA